ncbi:transporter substrate-binding domain-containing protein [Agrobacterium rosae]|nr:transporter substrate-binding domain-containing protein [Agrobacterium rosae]MCM2435769.1 transporter substrate-binding domain-containing protein [Agrobacterium rosae]
MNFVKLAALAAVLLLPVTTAAHAEDAWRKVRIAVEGVYPPFNYYDHGKLTGFDVEIGAAMCQSMKVECEWVTQEWDGMIPGLLAGKFDAIVASMRNTEERSKVISFSNKYYATPAVFMTYKGSGIADISPDALAGKVIGVQSATVQQTFLEKKYSKSELKTYAKAEDANADLAANRVDVVLNDKVLLAAWIKQSPDGECCELVGPDLNDPADWGPGMSVAVRKEDAKLREMFNSAIAEIRENGTYKTINDKYFDFSVY